MKLDERIEGLRNLRTGYDLTAAVGFWKELHDEDLIEEYADLARLVKELGDTIKHVLRNGQIGKQSERHLREALVKLEELGR